MSKASPGRMVKVALPWSRPECHCAPGSVSSRRLSLEQGGGGGRRRTQAPHSGFAAGFPRGPPPSTPLGPPALCALCWSLWEKDMGGARGREFHLSRVSGALYFSLSFSEGILRDGLREAGGRKRKRERKMLKLIV